MTRKAANKLAPGVYYITWKGTQGVSLAAIGQMYDGSRWLAPTNWLSPSTDTGAAWRLVERVDLIRCIK